MILKEMTINAILDYIEDNIEVSPIDINSLVEYSGYSRRYLQLLFLIILGCLLENIYNVEGSAVQQFCCA